MHPPSFSAALAIVVCSWVLRRVGVEFHLGPAGHSLRDARGRFKPKDGGGYGLPRVIPHHVADLMHGLGVTQQMYETAAFPLELPDDLTDIPNLQLVLRRWILRNMDHWVNTRGRSVAPVMNALLRTWALELYRHKPLHPARAAHFLRWFGHPGTGPAPAPTMPAAGVAPTLPAAGLVREGQRPGRTAILHGSPYAETLPNSAGRTDEGLMSGSGPLAAARRLFTSEPGFRPEQVALMTGFHPSTLRQATPLDPKPHPPDPALRGPPAAA